MQFVLRGRTDSSGRQFNNSDPLAGLKEVLAVGDFTRPEPIITWDDVSELAALDIDWRGPDEHRGSRLHDFLTRVSRSAPELRWQTHGGGLRLIFTRHGDFTADERAALYTLLLYQEGFGDFRIELKTDTRHPKYPRPGADGIQERCGDVHEGSGFKLDDRSFCARLMGDWTEVSDERIADFLAEKGWEIGRRYAHDQCLIDPSPHGKREPVKYLDRGIFSHVCQAAGRCHSGCSRPGFVPWQFLMEGDDVTRRLNPLRAAVRGVCHWEHARHVVAAATSCEAQSVIERFYRALLKLVHLKPGDSPEKRAAIIELIGRVFFPPIQLAHCGSDWFHTSTWRPAGNRGLREILQGLPAVKWVQDENGKITIRGNQQKLGFLLSNGDLTEHGYPPLKLVRGIDFGRNAFERPAVPVVTVAPANPPFRYYGLASRDIAWAERHLAEAFPGVRIDALRLIIAAKGIAQCDSHEPPRFFLKGQSGSGKSAHVTLAADLACDSVKSMRLTADLERSQRLLIEGAKAGTYVLVDEVDKDRKGRGIDPETLTTFVLSTGRGVVYHQLHVGFAQMTSVPVVCYAGCELPHVFRNDRQLARRVVLVDLESGILTTGQQWDETGGEIEGWRGRTPENARAADMLVSEVKDAFAGLTFARIVEKLGFQFIEAAGCFDGDPDAAKRKFFRVACETADTDNPRWAGKHWKAIPIDHGGPLADAFKEAIDAPIGDWWIESARQPLVAAHWGRVLGLPAAPIVCEFSRHGRVLAVRFRRGGLYSKHTVYNADCLSLEAGTSDDKAMTEPVTTASGDGVTTSVDLA